MRFLRKPPEPRTESVDYLPSLDCNRRQLHRWLSAGALFTATPSWAFPVSRISEFWGRMGVISDEVSDDLIEALMLLDEHGVGVVELRALYSSSAGRMRQVIDLKDQELALIRQILAGFRVSVINTPLFKTAAPGGTHPRRPYNPKHLEKIRRSLEVAQSMGANHVRMFSFYQGACNTAQRDAAYEAASNLGIIFARRALKPVNLLVENEASTFVSTTYELLEFLQRWPGFSGLWDPGNCAKVGEDPVASLTFLLDSGQIERIKHIQVKDIDADGNWVPVGQGIIDYQKIFTLLTQSGYFDLPDRTVGLETHCKIEGSKPRATQASLRALKQISKGNCSGSWF